MSKLKRKPDIILPTPEEDIAITAAAKSDPDTMLLDSNVKLVPLNEFKKRGRPLSVETKTRITIRYSPEVVAAFKATGRGWQTRMDVALKEWLQQHNPTDIDL